jgi:hypothetical protein
MGKLTTQNWGYVLVLLVASAFACESYASELMARPVAATVSKAVELRTATTKIACPTQDELVSVLVTSAAGWKADVETAGVQLRQDLIVEVQNLSPLWDQARCTTPEKKIILFLDGRPIPNVSPDPPTDPSSSKLIFPLRRDEKSRDAWTNILGYPQWSAREVGVSIGLESQHAVASTAIVKFAVIPHHWFALWSGVFLFIVILFVWIALASDVLRISGADPVIHGPNGPVQARKMYSLSRVQAAWWFFLMLASYLFIGLITGDYGSTITGTVLVLAGISAGTTLGSVVIDANEQAATLRAGVPPTIPPTTGSWLKDVLSDANGVSFHRFQMLVWTFVLGIIFILTVYRELAMPVFGETLLSLLGISAGTYLGMKIPEAK